MGWVGIAPLLMWQFSISCPTKNAIQPEWAAILLASALLSVWEHLLNPSIDPQKAPEG